MGSIHSANPTTYAKTKTARMRVFLSITIICAQMLKEKKEVPARKGAGLVQKETKAGRITLKIKRSSSVGFHQTWHTNAEMCSQTLQQESSM